MKISMVCLAAAAIALAADVRAQAPSPAPSPADAETNLLKLEIQRLRGDVEIMKGHIGRIVQYLQQRDAQSIAPQIQPQPQPQARAPQPGSGSSPARFSIAGAPTLGRADAPVTIVEFSDFECPFCQRFFKTTLPEIKRDYVDTGKLRYVFLDFPLEQMHAKARKAAEAAHCAAEQGKFWEMHDILFGQTADLDLRRYPEYARKLKLDAVAFSLCLSSGRTSGRINGGLASGRSAGISSTPSFIITKTDGGDLVGGGIIIKGAQPYDEFRRVIEQALAAN